MKRYIRATSNLDLPKGNYADRAVQDATTEKEIDDILFGSPDGLTRCNIMYAIRNPNISSETLIKLQPYADYYEESHSRFGEYINNPKVPKDLVSEVITREWPKIKESVDSGFILSSLFGLRPIDKIIDKISLPRELKEEIKYYIINGDDIAEQARQNAKKKKHEAIQVHMDSLTNKDIVKFLNSMGIDTTKHRYELYAEEYGRFESRPRYKKKFTCPGDYLAYFSMKLHQSPTAAAFEKAGYDTTELEEFISEYPTLEDISEEASSSWWGDGDDYIFYLENLDTDEYLYQGDEDWDY